MRRTILTVVVISLIAAAQPAHAGPKRSKYQLVFIDSIRDILAGNCRTIAKVMKGTSIVTQAPATRFTQQVTYCWKFGKKRGHHLTMVKWTLGVWIAAWWDVVGEYVGVVGATEWGGVGQNIAGRHQRGHFKVCVPWLNLCQNTYPWTQVEVFGRGGYKTSGGA